MADIATLTVRITAALGDFAEKMDEFGKKTEAAFEKVSGNSQILNVALGTLAAKGLAAVTSSLQLAATEFLTFSAELVKLEAKTGIAIGALQELKFVADSVGVPFETLTRVITDLQVELSKGQDTPFAKAMKLLQLSFEDLKQLKPEDQLQAILDKVQDFGKADQVAIMTAAFGRLGPEVLAVGTQMAALREEARRLGLVLSDEDVKAAETFGNQVDVLTKLLKAQAAEAIIPLIKELGDLKKWYDDTGASLKTWTTFQTDWNRAGAEHRVEILKLGLVYAQVARSIPALGRAFELITPSVVDLEEALRDAERDLKNFGKTVRTTDIELKPLTPPKKIVPPNYFAPTQKALEDGVKQLENSFSVWMRNRQPFGAIFNIYPERIEVDRTLLNHAALGAAVILHQEIVEIVTEHLKKEGFPPIFLPPPEITMAPADMTGIKKDLSDTAKELAEHAAAEFGSQIGDAIGQGIAQAISGADIGDVGATIGGGIGGALGAKIGETIATSIATSIGGELGAVAGGVVGSALGGVGAALGAYLGRKIAEGFSDKHLDEMSRAFITTAGGIDAMTEAAIGNAEAQKALLIIQNPIQMKRFEEATIAYAEAILEAEHAANKTATAFTKVAAAGGLVNAELKKTLLTDFNRFASPEATGKIFEFFKSQTQLAAEGLEAFVTNASISSQAAATAATGAIGAIFADMQLQGATAGQALAALAPSIAALTAQLSTTGFAGTEAFGQLSLMAQFAADKVSGPLFTAIGGLGNLMVGLNNTGALTETMFTGLAGQVTATWQQLVNMGKGGAAGMALIQKPLQKVWELTKDHGYAVDTATQALLDEAEAAGIVGDEMRDSGDKMLKAVQTLIDRIDALITQLSATMPAGAEAGAQKVQSALDDIEAPTITIPIEFDVPDFPDIQAPSSIEVGAAVSPQRDVVLEVDGEVLARSNARQTARVLAPYGV